MANPSEQASLGEWLAEEPYTLALSAGFFGFFAHAGVIGALSDHDLPPSAIRGSSGGAVTGALWASGLEHAELGWRLSELKRKDFWDPGIGYGLLKGEALDDTLRLGMPVTNFEDCRVPTSISVYDIGSTKTEVINTGDLVTAMRASSAVPGLFQPVVIDGRPKLDGGILDSAGYHDAPLDERILHHDLRRNPREPNANLRSDYKNLQRLRLANLPSVGPFSLYKGMVAYAEAFHQTTEALSQPVLV